MIKKVKKQNQNKINVASHWVLPLPMWLSKKKVYIVHKAADSSPTHKHAGRLGQLADTAACPGPPPSWGRAGSKAACSTEAAAVPVGALPTSDTWAHKLGGWRQLPISIIQFCCRVCMIWGHYAASAKLGALIFLSSRDFMLDSELDQ